MVSSNIFYVKESVHRVKNWFRLTWKSFRKQVKATRKLVVGYGLFDENPFRLLWKAFVKKVRALAKWVADTDSSDPWWSQFLISFGRVAVVENLIILNVAVFLIWQVADNTFMGQNFVACLGNFRSGCLHTMITSGFSHSDGDHIVGNMVFLYYHGKKVVHKFGPKYLLKLYLAGVIAGSTFFLLERASIKDGSGESEWGTMGASAAVIAIQLLDLFYIPRQKKYSILKCIAHSASILLGIYIVWVDVSLLLARDEEIGAAGHLGGAAVAAITLAGLMIG